MNKVGFLLFASLMVAGCQTSEKAHQAHTGTPSANRKPATTMDSKVLQGLKRGAIEDCIMSPFLYSQEMPLLSECAPNYAHFFPATISVEERAPAQIRVGSFNLYHLGDNQSVMKNYDLVAKVMNQWDVVAGQEFMPLPNDFSKDNRQVVFAMGLGFKNAEIEQSGWSVIEPGYILVLKELRKLDPSWALIMQPNAEGEGSSGEMAGFYYRSRYVRLKDFPYCPAEGAKEYRDDKIVRNIGCVLQVPEKQRKLMSRVAFAAYFRAGNFDFVAMTAHVRFRQAIPPDIKLQKAELCARHPNPAKCNPSNDTVGRFYEVKAVVDQMKEIKRVTGDDDILYMGDFNLEKRELFDDMWAAATASEPDLKVYQTDPTTLSIVAKKLVSNYDHYLFNPKATSECLPETAHAFNYMAMPPKVEPGSAFDAIATKLTPEARQAMFDQKSVEVSNLIRPQNGNVASLVRRLQPKEEQLYLNSFKKSIKRMEKSKYGAIVEMLSDHLPVEITCNTN
jgi:hypothetical protein